MAVTKKPTHAASMKKAAEHHAKAEHHMKEAKKWITGAIKHPGALREELHCLLYTSPSPRDRQKSRMPSSA